MTFDWLAHVYQFSGIVASLGSLYFAYMASRRAGRAEHEARTIHIQVNSRMDKLLSETQAAALHRGREEERNRLIMEKLEAATEAAIIPCQLMADIKAFHCDMLEKARHEGKIEGMREASVLITEGGK